MRRFPPTWVTPGRPRANRGPSKIPSTSLLADGETLRDYGDVETFAPKRQNSAKHYPNHTPDIAPNFFCHSPLESLFGNGLGCLAMSMLPGAVSFPLGRSTLGAMEATDIPTTHGGSFAPHCLGVTVHCRAHFRLPECNGFGNAAHDRPGRPFLKATHFVVPRGHRPSWPRRQRT
jgi:hypothetical protein